MTLTEQQLSILKVLFKADPSIRKALLKHADKKLVCTLCECVYNILLGNVKLSTQDQKRLVKNKSLLKRVVKKTKNWKNKRKVIQKGGNILISLLTPLLGSILSKVL
jgi:hypothetical protein